ncbi:GMC family oxidoreductase [Burkholderia cenocepacia]|uniref:GMC family oxidoreductase n=1 Tax=Burkholderia cenocepacia TaxID=95486 RepID=UPI00084725ED|nr:GMC oxidoreductase [Burkholderia cenocepacia]
MSPDKYDIIVVGAGSAGCMVAGYLAAHTSASIAILEAGGSDIDPLIHIPGGYAKILAADMHVWKYDTVPVFDKVRPYRAGKVLGGGSSVNAMSYVRGQPRDFAAWQQAAGSMGRWSFEDLLPHFIAMEDHQSLKGEFHGHTGGVKVALPEKINQLNQYCVEAFQAYGLPFNEDYNGQTQIGVAHVQSNIGDHKRCNAVDAFLRPHLKSGRVDLILHADATKILIEASQAVGVEYVSKHEARQILADQVILSAGTVHSAQILMHSGIGPAEQLQRHGIEVKVNAPDVGENLHDHPVLPVRHYVKGTLGYQSFAHGLGTVKAGLEYLLKHEGPASGSGIESVAYWNPANLAADPTIQCYHTPIISTGGLVPTGNRSGLTFSLALLQPRSRGWVRLADDDPTSMPLINPNFLGNDDDVRDLVAAVKAVRQVMQCQPLAAVLEEEVSPGPDNQSDKQLAEWAKSVVSTMWHPVGTCRMGQDARAVVDARLRVKGVERLRVIDASVMPKITSGNTMAPTFALARHGASMLVHDLTT